MKVLKLYSLFDSGVGAFMTPFWAEHKADAIRSFATFVNDRSDPNNKVANWPDQFTLFELGEFSHSTGRYTELVAPTPLGVGVEYVGKHTFAAVNSLSAVA